MAHSLEHLVALVAVEGEHNDKADGLSNSDPFIADCNICLESAISGTLDTILCFLSTPSCQIPVSSIIQVVAVITDWDAQV